MTEPPLELLDRYDPQVRSLALGLRAVVHEEMAPCHEYIFAMRSKVVLLYGATERVIDDGICHINVFVRHTNLGFSRGTELDDPGGVLRGTSRAMRHITLKAPADLKRPEIRAYLRQARRHAGLTRPRQRTADKVVTRVKPKSPTTQTWPMTLRECKWSRRADCPVQSCRSGARLIWHVNGNRNTVFGGVGLGPAMSQK